MMKKCLLVSSLVLPLLLGGTVASAQTYGTATKGQGEGSIKFEHGDAEIMSPEDNKTIVEPIGEINLAKDDLVLQYVSNFNFGNQKTTTEAKSYNAKLDTVKKANVDTKVVPFVSTKDLRTDRKAGWTLNVTPSKFTTGTGANEVELKGVEMVILNSLYNGTPIAPSTNPKVVTNASNTTGVKLIPGSPIQIASSTKATDEGLGSYSLALGDVSGETTTGVKLNVPANTAMKTETYKAILDWELVAAP